MCMNPQQILRTSRKRELFHFAYSGSILEIVTLIMCYHLGSNLSHNNVVTISQQAQIAWFCAIQIDFLLKVRILLWMH